MKIRYFPKGKICFAGAYIPWADEAHLKDSLTPEQKAVKIASYKRISDFTKSKKQNAFAAIKFMLFNTTAYTIHDLAFWLERRAKKNLKKCRKKTVNL